MFFSQYNWNDFLSINPLPPSFLSFLLQGKLAYFFNSNITLHGVCVIIRMGAGCESAKEADEQKCFLGHDVWILKLFWNYFRYKVKDCARRDLEKDLTRVNVVVKVLKNSRIAIGEGKLTKLNGSRLRAFFSVQRRFFGCDWLGEMGFFRWKKEEVSLHYLFNVGGKGNRF